MDTGLKKDYDDIIKRLKEGSITENEAIKLTKKAIKKWRQGYIDYLSEFHTQNEIANFKRFFGFRWR